MISIEAYCSTTDRGTSPMPKIKFPSEVEMFIPFLLFLLFSLLYLLILLLHALFALFLLITIDFVYVNSVRFKHIDSSCHFLELNCRVYNLNFLKLKQLLIDGDIESNSGLHRMIVNL